MLCLGLMSGTSLDGVDAALLDTDGETIGARVAAITVPYPDHLREGLRAVLGGQGPVAETERAVTLFHAEVVRELVARAGIAPGDVALAGFHGHTILHRPEQRKTWQIGDGALLAESIGIPVVNEFRIDDVAAGGQGAPLVPVFHRAIAESLEKPVALLNIGGVANVTLIGADGELLAFDTGPGNALIDEWARRHSGRLADIDGALARAGRVDEAAVARFLAHPWFGRLPPKSLDRDDFREFVHRLVDGSNAENGAATLTAFTAAAVAAARTHLAAAPRRWLVCGGGRRNPVLMAELARRLGAPVAPVESEGWDGDALEAQAFAYLAARSVRGLPYSWPGTTGVPKPLSGGRLHGKFRGFDARL